MIAAQAVGTAVSATTGTLTVAWPAHVANDIALLWVTSSAGGTTNALTTANGFTLIGTQTTGTGTAGTQLSVYWCRATSSAMASPVLTAGTDFKYGVITTFRGCVATGTPYEANTGGVKAAASTTLTMNGVTTLSADALVVYGISSDVDAATAFHTSTANSGLTLIKERFDAGTISGLGGGIAVVTGTDRTPGALGAATATVVSSINAYHTIALAPAAPVTLPYTETFTGTTGASIAPPWYDRKLSAGTATIQANTGRLTSTTTLNDIVRMEGLGVPILDDVDFSGTFHGNAANAKYVDIFIAGSTEITAGNWEPTDAFVIEIEITAAGTTSGTNLIRSVGGVTTVLGTRVAMTINPQTNVYGFRFQKTTTGGTTTVRYRVWDTAGAEPGTWDQSVTATNLTGIPGFELISNTAVVQTMDFDDLVVSSGGLTASPGGIATAEAFGTPVASMILTSSPTGIATGEAFGTPVANVVINAAPTGIASGEAFGVPTATATLTASPTGVASAEAFGTPGAIIPRTASPGGIATAEAFGTASVTGALTATPTGIASAEAFGAPTATMSNAASPTGIATAEAFGAPAAIIPITAAPTGIATGEAFGTPVVNTGFIATPTGIASAEAFGAPTAIIPRTASPTGIASGEAFGVPTETGLLTASPTGIVSGEAFGVPVVSGVLTASPTGIVTAEAFGVPAAAKTLTSAPTGVASAEAFGVPVVTILFRYTAFGIVTAEAFGVPTATLGADPSRDMTFTVEPLVDRYVSDALQVKFTVEPATGRYDKESAAAFTADPLTGRYAAEPL